MTSWTKWKEIFLEACYIFFTMSEYAWFNKRGRFLLQQLTSKTHFLFCILTWKESQAVLHYITSEMKSWISCMCVCAILNHLYYNIYRRNLLSTNLLINYQLTIVNQLNHFIVWTWFFLSFFRLLNLKLSYTSRYC